MSKKTLKEKIIEIKQQISDFTELNGLDYNEFIYTALREYLMKEKYLPNQIELKPESPTPKTIKKESMEYNKDNSNNKGEKDFYGE